jgi:hypothetical protein
VVVVFSTVVAWTGTVYVKLASYGAEKMGKIVVIFRKLVSFFQHVIRTLFHCVQGE